MLYDFLAHEFGRHLLRSLPHKSARMLDMLRSSLMLDATIRAFEKHGAKSETTPRTSEITSKYFSIPAQSVIKNWGLHRSGLKLGCKDSGRVEGLGFRVLDLRL